MQYGCIGEHLVHSFSKEIHNKIGDYDYILREVARGELDAFMTERDFAAINVTIPYKQAVIPYLAEMSGRARAIGAVNTVVNRGGKLYGYNTDFAGMKALIGRTGINVSGKKVLILGTGGTSKTAAAVAADMGARQILRLSRTPSGIGVIGYDEAYARHSDAEVIINTTPCGMYPMCDGIPIEPERFPRLEGVADAIYNPLRSNLVRRAAAHGAAASGGLYMLVAQAVAAAELFFDAAYGESVTESVYRGILSAKENIVLTGMPACGKSTVAKLLSERTGRTVYDTDALIVEREGMEITDIFAKHGEEYFRDAESAVIRDVSQIGGCIIATGGGAVLRSENVSALKSNGRVYFIEKPLGELIPTDDRPLAHSAEAIRKRYSERYATYCAAADEIIAASGDHSSSLAADEIERSMNK